ncbi:MAG: PQQ-dependent sugar dehydrogenase [Planctomycetes bacterium]|nr:PQQ-dependent sugar dehydrogenase [Planctomycetota bacterium]
MAPPTIRPLALFSLCLTPALLLGGVALAQEPAPAEIVDQEPPVDFPKIKLTQVAKGMTQPLYGTAAPGQPERLYLLEKAGVIKVLELGGPRIRLREQPFLNISKKVSTRSERGLLGLAFAADYVSSGIFYIHYNNLEGDTILARMTVDPADRLRAHSESEEILLQQKQPWANHDGGELCFGPDGMLYLGLGDGGAANDPQNNGQKPGSLLGKILRLNVSGGVGSPYTVPEDNPFVGDNDFRPEIWSWGLRNPWRFSFDRETGDLWIGDVGQNKWEEVNFAPASSMGGENYGWRVREAAHLFNNKDPKPDVPLIDPIFEYRQGGPLNARSVTGGYVYRGSKIPGLHGWYVFGDYVSGQIWALKQENGELIDEVDLTPMLAGKSDRGAVPSLASFAEDAGGELYVMSLSDGTVYRIDADR